MDSRRARGAALTVLALSAVNGLLFNLWHAFDAGLPTPLAIFFGGLPVLVSAGTSAMAANDVGGWAAKTAAYVVILGTIGLSVYAQYAVLMTYLDNVFVAITYPSVFDVATIIALHKALAPIPAATAQPTSKPTPAPAARPARVAPARQAPPAAVSAPTSRTDIQAPAVSATPTPHGQPAETTIAGFTAAQYRAAPSGLPVPDMADVGSPDIEIDPLESLAARLAWAVRLLKANSETTGADLMRAYNELAAGAVEPAKAITERTAQRLRGSAVDVIEGGSPLHVVAS